MTSDDLKDINGIGPKTLKTLNAANITTLKQLSTLTIKDLESLDGIGSTKAKQFINEAKRKLKTTEGKDHSIKTQNSIISNKSIIQQIKTNIENIFSRLEKSEKKFKQIENYLGLAEENHNRGKYTQEIMGTPFFTKLKRDLIEEISDPELFRGLIKDEIKNYLREQKRSITGREENQSEKIPQLQEQIKDLEHQIVSLKVLLNQKYSLDEANKAISNKIKKSKAESPIKPQVEESLETPRTLKSQKPPMRKKNIRSKEENVISKPIQTLEDIEDYIKNLLHPGDSIEVDELIKKKQLQTVSLSKLKKAIYDLIEKEIITPAVSNTSVQKINGKIGKLTRVK